MRVCERRHRRTGAQQCSIHRLASGTPGLQGPPGIESRDCKFEVSDLNLNHVIRRNGHTLFEVQVNLGLSISRKSVLNAVVLVPKVTPAAGREI